MSKKKAGKGGRRRAFLRVALWGGVLALVFFGVVGGYFVGVAWGFDLGEFAALSDRGRLEEAAAEDYAFLHGEKPILLSAEEFPQHLRDALVAREDSRFWRHSGIDFFGVGRAALRNLEEGRLREGAGTITMQVARTVYGQREHSLRRKVVEMLLAWRIERRFTKTQILEAYMNWVFLGEDNHGFERASLEYFGKSARGVTLGEGAVLVGMLRAPNRFHPRRHYEAALGERDGVLARMVDEGMLSEGEAAAELGKGVRVLLR